MGFSILRVQDCGSFHGGEIYPSAKRNTNKNAMAGLWQESENHPCHKSSLCKREGNECLSTHKRHSLKKKDYAPFFRNRKIAPHRVNAPRTGTASSPDQGVLAGRGGSVVVGGAVLETVTMDCCTAVNGVEPGVADINITALTCCPSTMALIIVVPVVAGVNVVVFKPFAVSPLDGWTLPVPPGIVNVTGMPFGTNRPLPEVSKPVELYVRLIWIADV